MPRRVEHTFEVGDGGARLLTLTVPSGFAAFVAELGEPAATVSLPEQAPADEQRLTEVAERFGIVITGPPAS